MSVISGAVQVRVHSVLKQKSSGPTPAEINTELRSVVVNSGLWGLWWSIVVCGGCCVVSSGVCCINNVIWFWFSGKSLKQRLSNCERSFKTPSEAHRGSHHLLSILLSPLLPGHSWPPLLWSTRRWWRSTTSCSETPSNRWRSGRESEQYIPAVHGLSLSPLCL